MANRFDSWSAPTDMLNQCSSTCGKHDICVSADDGVIAGNGCDHAAGRGLGGWDASDASGRRDPNRAAGVLRLISLSRAAGGPQGLPKRRLNTLEVTDLCPPEGTTVPARSVSLLGLTFDTAGHALSKGAGAADRPLRRYARTPQLTPCHSQPEFMRHAKPPHVTGDTSAQSHADQPLGMNNPQEPVALKGEPK